MNEKTECSRGFYPLVTGDAIGISQAGLLAAVARKDVMIERGGAVVVAAGNNVRAQRVGSLVLGAGNSVIVDQGRSLVTAGRSVRMQDSRVWLAFGNVHLDAESVVVSGTIRSALVGAIGAIGAIVMVLGFAQVLRFGRRERG